MKLISDSEQYLAIAILSLTRSLGGFLTKMLMWESVLSARTEGVVGLWAAVKMARLVRSRVLVGEVGESGDELEEDADADVVGAVGDQEAAEVW
jgi:hypothetical protein